MLAIVLPRCGAASAFAAAFSRCPAKGRSSAPAGLVWLAISLAGVAAGMRFFPRYYFQFLPVVVLLAARGFADLEGRRRASWRSSC